VTSLVVVPPALGDATDGFSADKDFGMGGRDRSLTMWPGSPNNQEYS